MPRDDYTGVPTVTPEIQAPDDYQRVEASPAAFGGQLAEAGRDAGQAGLQLSQFYGEVAADNGVNDAITQATHILRGDPSRGVATGADGKPLTAPDGTPVYNGGYFGLRGADAMNASKEVDAQLQETIADARASLQTPQARLKYDTEVRRYYNQWQNEMGEHYDQQYQDWMVTTNQNRIDLTKNQVSTHINDPAALAQDQETLRNFYVKLETAQHGSGPDIRAGAILHADQAFYLTQINSLVGSDPSRAQQVLDQGRQVLSSLPTYDEIVSRVRGADFNARAGPLVDAAVAADINGAPVPGMPATSAGGASYISTITAHESGGNAEARNPHGSATGKEQFVSRTWYDPQHPQNSVMGQPEFAGLIAGKSYDQIEALRTEPAISDRATMVYARMNGEELSRDGDPVNSMTLGLAHGFGAGGAHALLHAAPDTPVGQVLPAAIPQNPAYAHMTAGQVVADYTRRFGTGQVDLATGATSGNPATSSGPMSRADYLRSNMPALVATFRAKAEAAFPNDSAMQDEVVGRYQRAMEQQITQQDQQYLVDTHTVTSFMVTQKPISEQELQGDPAVSAAWARMQIENPLQAAGVERMFEANAKGVAGTFGTEIKGYIDRILSPQGDPNRIQNPAQLAGMVSSGEDAPLTNSGVAALSGLMRLRNGSPAGEAIAAQARQFIDQMHGELTYSNPGVGRYDVQGEARFTKFLAAVLPGLEAAAKNGTLAQALDPNSPNYLGKAALPFMRSRPQMMRDAVTDPSFSPGALTVQSLTALMNSLDNDAQRQETLRAAVASGRLPQPVYDAYLASLATPLTAAVFSNAAAAAAGAPSGAPSGAPAGSPAQSPAFVAPPAAPGAPALSDAEARARLRAEGIHTGDIP